MPEYLPFAMLNLLFGILTSIGLFGFQDSAKVVKEAPIHSLLEQKLTYTLHPDFSFTIRDEKILTILTADGLRHGSVVLGYDNLQSIRDFELEMIEPITGKTIKKVKLKDMADRAVQDNSFLLDDRYKYYDLTAPRFPVTVKIKTEIHRNTNFYYPEWMPVRFNHQKVNESTLVFNYPTTLGLKYKELNLRAAPEIKESSGITTVTWMEKDLEVQTPSFDLDKDPKVLLAPMEFAINEFHGEMKDWAGLASWQYKLNEGRGSLPEDFQHQILAMVKDIENPYEKVSILYDYLQRNYRYVSIQLGIGGWQTMTAREVVENKFGDCKALTNLMKSMLEVAGIPSFYTLVRAGEGEDDIEIELPSIQFNHVILQVPTDKDPIWLECTSNLNPAGYLGTFTRNRHVLVTTRDGGYLTKTPDYSSQDWNKIKTNSKLVITDQGAAQISTVWQNQGNPAMIARQVVAQLDDREKRDYLNRNSAVAGLIVEDYEIKTDRMDSIPTSEIAYSGVIQRFTQATAKRVILRSFLSRISEAQVTADGLFREDLYTIEFPEDLEMEGGNERVVTVEGEGYQGKVILTKTGKTLQVQRELALQLKPDMESDAKSALLKEVNSKFEQTVTFIKPTLSTTRYE